MLRFDDSFQDQWVNVLPLLQKYGFKAVFAIIAGTVQNQSVSGLSEGWEEMSWQEVQWLYSNGYEVGDHTMTHAHLDHESCYGLNHEIVSSKNLLAQHGIGNLSDFILPYSEGYDNNTITSLIYQAGFPHIFPDNQAPVFSNYGRLQTQWVDIDAKDGESLTRFESYANQASSTNVIGFTFHHVNDNVCCTVYYVNQTNFANDMAFLNRSGFTMILPIQLPGYLDRSIPVTLSYSVQGGGFGYSSPKLTYAHRGQELTATLNTSPTVYYTDLGGVWNVSKSLLDSLSTSPNERWQTGQITNGIARASQEIIFEYYHQFRESFSYSIDNSSAPTSIVSILAATQFGNSYNASLTTTQTSFWLDGGSKWTVASALVEGSSSSPHKMWQTRQVTSGTATSPISIVFAYYLTQPPKTSSTTNTTAAPSSQPKPVTAPNPAQTMSFSGYMIAEVGIAILATITVGFILRNRKLASAKITTKNAILISTAM
jgi:hypothetical protein